MSEKKRRLLTFKRLFLLLVLLAVASAVVLVLMVSGSDVEDDSYLAFRLEGLYEEAPPSMAFFGSEALSVRSLLEGIAKAGQDDRIVGALITLGPKTSSMVASWARGT